MDAQVQAAAALYLLLTPKQKDEMLALIAIMFLIIVFLAVWCVYIDFHCIDYGFWRGIR